MSDVMSTPLSAAKIPDRFIPQRSIMNKDVSHFNLMTASSEGSSENLRLDSPSRQYKSSIAQSLFGDEACQIEEHKILALKNKAPAPRAGYQNRLKVLYAQNVGKKVAPTRAIPSAAIKVLDAPGLVDDYYLNLVDWNANNVLAVALGSTVYLWDASSSNVQELVTLPELDVTSVSFSPANPGYLAIGTEDHRVLIWDTTAARQVREMRGHEGRVASLSWNSHILSSGSFDSRIINNDVRVAQSQVSVFSRHEGEVCGLKWSLDGTTLASGGNDNQLNLWQMGNNQPLFHINEHRAAVKALAWCPWESNLLASGGGTADKCIKFWNTKTGAMLQSVETDSQVCALQWSRHSKELVSSHGFSKNQLCVWKYPSMVRVAELTGHTARVLHMAMSPDGTTALTASADESLRFWKVFEPRVRATSQAAKAAPVRKAETTATRPIASSMNKIR